MFSLGKFKFTWKIENFSMLPHQKGKFLLSPVFCVDILDKTEWCLVLFPRGDSRETSKGYLSCAITQNTPSSSNKTILKLGCSLIIETADNSFDELKSIANLEVGNSISVSKFIALKILYQNKDLYLPRDVLTIRCRLWPSESTVLVQELNLLLNQCSSITRIDVNRRSVTWIIPKIKERMNIRNKTSIHVDTVLDMPSFKLSFFFSDDLNCEYAQVEITQTSFLPNKKVPFVKCKITVISACEEYQHSYEDSHLFNSNPKEIWRFPEFIKIKNLVDDKYIYLDNTLCLLCEVSFAIGDAVSHVEIPSYLQSIYKVKKPQEINYLSSSIQNLYLSGKFCDVNLQAGDQTFPAHKIVLCARSPVFSAMFDADMKEKNTNVVEIADVDPNTLKKMLEFLHSDVMEQGMSTGEVCELYSAADKYQIATLKQKCTALLLSSMSESSVCEILYTADLHQDNFLLTIVHNFLKIHPETFQLPDWEIFLNKYPKLFGKTMIRILKGI